MTNFNIVVSAAVANKLYTQEQAEEIIATKGELPLHTFAEWKARGYAVKKGEHARLTTKIWKYKKEKVEMTTKDGDTIEEDSHDYYLVKAFFFTNEQVEKIA